MQRRLVARQFVPTAEAGTEAEAAASAQGGSASGAKDANSPPAAELGEAGGSSDKASASQPGEAGSSKAGEAAAPAATQKEVEVEAEELPPPLAQELEAALAQHCPDVSLAELQKAALALRLFLGCRAVGEQSADGPSFQARAAAGLFCFAAWSVLCSDSRAALGISLTQTSPQCSPRCSGCPFRLPGRPSSAHCCWTASSCLTWTPLACTPMCGPPSWCCTLAGLWMAAAWWACLRREPDAACSTSVSGRDGLLAAAAAAVWRFLPACRFSP